MGWLRRLFGSSSAGGDAGGPDRVADLAASLQKSGALERLEAQLLRLRGTRLNARELASWHVLWIATAFRRGDRIEAFARASRALEALPDHPEVLFAMGQEQEFRGALDEMVRLFRRSLFPGTSAHHALTAARYCYLRGRVPEALEFVRPVIEAHFSLRIADDTFLWLRQMPFASVTFGTAACLHVVNGAPGDARALLTRASRVLSDCDLKPQLVWIDAVEHEQPDTVAAAIRAARAPHVSTGPLGGLDGMKWAVWTARSRASRTEAEEALNRTRVTDEDAWLEDARRLSLAEACFRFGDVSGEADLIGAFLRQQPLLLEPHWALAFGFVAYQERVKRAFWVAGTGRADAV